VSTIEQRPDAYHTLKTERKGSILASWLSSTDHKIIRHMYLITSFFMGKGGGAVLQAMQGDRPQP
jgi:cytochrome c oxidase subunit 1